MTPIFFCSYGQHGTIQYSKEAEHRIVQESDGTVSLKIEKAACYNDAVNPSNNTADWNVVITKPG
jgi:hypothetical protein